MTQPTLTVELGYLSGWTLGTSLLGTDTYLAEVTYSQDISADVRSVSIRRGRQHELNRIEAGTASVQVLNQDGAFTRIPPMTNIRIRATFVDIPHTGLVGWWDFSDVNMLWQDTAGTTPVTANGQTIGRVTDQGSAAVHLTQSTAGSRPQYKVAIQNGNSISRYDGTDDHLFASGAPLGGSVGGADYTLIVASKFGTATANDVLFALRNSGSGNPIKAEIAPSSATLGLFFRKDDGTGLVTSGVTDVDDNTFRIYAARESSLSQSVWINGGAANDTDALSAGAVTVNTTSIGAAVHTSVTDFLNGDVGEVLLYNSALSTANLNQVGNYLASKWGITWTTVP